MLIKYKRKLQQKSINNITLRLQRKGFISYPVYALVIIHKKSRAAKGECLDKIGSFNPNFNERFFFFDSYKLYYWLEHGIKIHYKVKRYLMKFLVVNKNKKKFNVII